MTRMNNELIFENQFDLEDISIMYADKIKKYWESKGFHLTYVNPNLIVGKRGSVLKNHVTSNMMKLKSTLFIKIEDYSVHSTLEVNTVGQVITYEERRYWPLELEAFKQYLLFGESMEEDFKQYYKEAKKAVGKIYLIIGIIVFFVLLFYWFY